VWLGTETSPCDDPAHIQEDLSTSLRFGRGDMEKVGCRGVSSSGAKLHSVQRRYRNSPLKRRWEKYEYSWKTFYAELDAGALVMSSEMRSIATNGIETSYRDDPA